MASTTLRTIRLKSFIALCSALVLVGASGALLVYTNAVQSGRERDRQELVTLANVMAREVDSQLHETLTDREHEASTAYTAISERLSEMRQSAPGLRYIYTIRKVGDAYFFVVDPTKPGDADLDGIDDKSYLMDPYPDIPREAIAAFETGMSQSSPEPYSDRWGTFISAFTPIVDSAGRTVAVLGIDRDISFQIAQEWRLQIGILASLLAIAVLSAIMAWALATHLARHLVRLSDVPLSEMPRTSTRSVVLETVLYAILVTIVTTGIVALYASGQDIAEHRRINAVQASANRALATLSTIATGEPYDGAILAALSEKLERNGDIQLATRLRLGHKALLAEPRAAGTTAHSLIGAVRDHMLNIEAQGEQFGIRLAERNQWIVMFALVSTLMALATAAAIRVASRQQQQLLDATLSSTQFSSVYQQLVERLPIGLFAYSSEGFEFYNPAWAAHLTTTEDGNAWFSFAQMLHPDDRERTLRQLRVAENERAPFEVEMRLLSPGGDVTYMQCKGVPVFGAIGRYQHMLAFAIDTTRTIESEQRLQRANLRLTNALADLKHNFEATVHALVKAVDAKDPYTAGHSERVTEYSLRIAKGLGLDQVSMHTLEMGALIHDIGKIGVPDHILVKPAALTREEFNIVKQHPSIGYTMIQGIPRFSNCAGIVRWHHERLDGSGYPDGLEGSQIDLLSRIVSVADAFDAMTSTRAYRMGMDLDQALHELRRDAMNGKLDAKVVEVFAEIIKQEGAITPPSQDAA